MSAPTRTKPELVEHPSYPGPGRWDLSWPTYVADFSADERPAYRVKCHCRNCSWEGQARFSVGHKIRQWLPCPKCEVRELSAHGEFVTRDEKSREEHLADVTAAYAKREEMWAREKEIRNEAVNPAPKKRGLFS